MSATWRALAMNSLLMLIAVLSASCHDHQHPRRRRFDLPQPNTTTARTTARTTTTTTDARHDPRLPRSDRELPTTSASIFFGNLDGSIARLAQRVEDEPRLASARRDLSVLLYTRAKVRGDLDELARALAVVSEAIALDKANAASSYLARANELQTMHRFAEARKDLERAQAQGADPSDIEPIETELDYVQGRYEKAIPAIRRAVATRRSSASVARLALLEHDLGNIETADRLFSEAESLVRDPNPIPVAWLFLQRGVHCQTTGQLERAVVFFREAARRIPHYVAAEEHLAETLHALGQDDEALRLYEAIVVSSPDPEFKGALAGLYRSRGRTEEADHLLEQARAQYATLLAKYPEAMYWHASELFLGEGKNPRLALELLEKNVALRPGAPSFVALARADLENGNPDAAKVAIDKALGMPLVSAEMFWTGSLAYDALAKKRATTNTTRATDTGNEPSALTKTAEALRAKARALDPRIGIGHDNQRQ